MMTGELRLLNQRLSAPGRLAAILTVLAVIVILVSLRGLFAAVTAPSAKDARKMAEERKQQLAAEYTTSMDGHIAQFNGRSVFFIPGKPIPPPPPPPPPSNEEKKDPPPPPPPSVYGGPKLIAMVNGVAWFDDGKKLMAGGETKDKLRVKEIKAPWDAVVEWDGVEFTVSLFDRDKVVYPPPKVETKKPDEAKKDEPKKEDEKKPEATPEDKKPGDPDAKPAEAPKSEPVKESGPSDVKKEEKPKQESAPEIGADGNQE